MKVSPHITHAVLLDLAQWDFPGGKNFKSVENIAYATKLPHQEVIAAMAVLRGIGILRQSQREDDQSPMNRLDCDRIEALRVPFRSGGADRKLAAESSHPEQHSQLTNVRMQIPPAAAAPGKTPVQVDEADQLVAAIMYDSILKRCKGVQKLVSPTLMLVN